MDIEAINKLEATAPEPAPELDGVVKDEPVADDVEPDKKDMPDSSGNKPDDGHGKVKQFMQKIGLLKGEEPEEEKQDKNIPDEFTEFARSQGWSDEEITDFAGTLTNEELLELLPHLMEQDEEQEEAPAKEEAKPNQPKEPETDQEKLIAELRKEIAEIKAAQDEQKEHVAQQTQRQMLLTANKMFDEAAKDFKVFGETDKLLRYPAGPKKGQVVPTQPAMKARNEVWTKAQAFMELGEGIEEAIKDALMWFKGKNLEVDVHRKLLRDLKKHETKLSAKRVGKETIKQYEDEDERKADVVREAARRAGVKGNFEQE